MKKINLLILLILVIGCTTDYSHITNYEECVNAGFPIMESYPEQCATPDGRTFTRELEAFCGWSTNATCTNNSECVIGGCSSQVCQGAGEQISTTCEYKECYNHIISGYECICVGNKCEWNKN